MAPPQPIVPPEFHPSYPDLWQISLFGSAGVVGNKNNTTTTNHRSSFVSITSIHSIKLQEEKPQDPDNEELSVQAAHDLQLATGSGAQSLLSVPDRVRLERLEFHKGKRLLAGQTFQAQPYGRAWLQTAKGYYLPLLARRNAYSIGDESSAPSEDHRESSSSLLVAQPFWPSYRVVSGIPGSSTSSSSSDDKDEDAVAPYICNMEDLLVDAEEETCESCAVLAWKDYNVKSPLRAPALTKRVGYVFWHPEVPVKGGAVDVRKCPWWTPDGQVWWPKSVPSYELWGKKLPNKVACITVPPKPIMAHAVMISSDYVRFCFFDRGHWLILLILTEYLMIVAGVLAGLEWGWTVSLQFVYLACLVLLSLCEVLFVGNMLPNGILWMKLNYIDILEALSRSAMARWDLYSDVGFAVLMYELDSRNATAVRLWIGATVATAISIGFRLPYSLYYARYLSKEVNVKNLANVAAPSYMTLFQFLCETMANNDGANVRKVTVTTELWFEAFMLICLALPEIVLQAVHIFLDDTSACPGCGKGFVVISLFVSIVTAPSMTFRAYRKYMNVSAEIASKNNNEELAPQKSRLPHNPLLEYQEPTYPETISI